MEVPFAFQAWVFNSLIDDKVEMLHTIIDAYADEIKARAKVRHKDGFLDYGSEMYTWDSTRRLNEVLDELADAAVYQCSGPVAFDFEWGVMDDYREESGKEYEELRETRPRSSEEEEGAEQNKQCCEPRPDEAP